MPIKTICHVESKTKYIKENPNPHLTELLKSLLFYQITSSKSFNSQKTHTEQSPNQTFIWPRTCSCHPISRPAVGGSPGPVPPGSAASIPQCWRPWSTSPGPLSAQQGSSQRAKVRSCLFCCCHGSVPLAWHTLHVLLWRKSRSKAKLGVLYTVKGVWWNQFLAYTLFEKIGRFFSLKRILVSELEAPNLLTLRTPVLVVLYPHEGSERGRGHLPPPGEGQGCSSPLLPFWTLTRGRKGSPGTEQEQFL